MAEPQPSTIHEGASPPASAPVASAAAEAAALSSLDNKSLNEPSAAPKKEVDMKALNDAMKALESVSGGAGSKGAASSGKKVDSDAEPVKVVKVDAADVTVLAEQLDVSRPKATELLRTHDLDVVKAMKAWVAA
ncbi:hypothetical protein Q7P37_007156 [Cladosporium fusiforme]